MRAAPGWTTPLSLAALTMLALPGQDPGKVPAPKRLFDPAADHAALLRTALAKATAKNQRVLLVFGKEEDPRCGQLQKAFAGSAFARLLNHWEYVPVFVPAENVTLGTMYGVANDKLPHLAILGADGKELARFVPPADAAVDAAAVAELLQAHKAAPLAAEAVLAAGLERAKKAEKLLFLHFDAPW